MSSKAKAGAPVARAADDSEFGEFWRKVLAETTESRAEQLRQLLRARQRGESHLTDGELLAALRAGERFDSDSAALATITQQTPANAAEHCARWRELSAWGMQRWGGAAGRIDFGALVTANTGYPTMGSAPAPVELAWAQAMKDAAATLVPLADAARAAGRIDATDLRVLRTAAARIDSILTGKAVDAGEAFDALHGLLSELANPASQGDPLADLRAKLIDDVPAAAVLVALGKGPATAAALDRAVVSAKAGKRSKEATARLKRLGLVDNGSARMPWRAVGHGIALATDRAVIDHVRKLQK